VVVEEERTARSDMLPLFASSLARELHSMAVEREAAGSDASALSIVWAV